MDEELREYLSVMSGQMESIREILKGIYEELVFLRGDQDERHEQLRKLYEPMNVAIKMDPNVQKQLDLALQDEEPLWE